MPQFELKLYTPVLLLTPCPKCGGSLIYKAREDEFGTNELHPYEVNECTDCGHQIKDFEEDFRYPDATT